MRLAIELMEDHSESSVEDLIDAIIDIVERDRRGYIASCGDEGPNLAVLACIDATLLHLENASMAFYASTK